MRHQFDLFAPSPAEGEKRAELRPARPKTGKTPPMDEAAMVQQLRDSGRYRILQRLDPPPTVPGADRIAFPRLGVVVDTETTGLNPAQEEIIEIGAVAFRYADDGSVGDVCATFGALQQPSKPIPADITRITGITDEMVKGQTIPRAELDALIADADLVIAHNAGFDRPFLERFSPVFENKPWACSVKEIDWTARGFEGTKLGYLIGQSGYFHNGHRAEDDCQALLAVLKEQSGDTTPFAELLKASRKSRMRIYAENSPFEMKDHLKARGYRWSDGTDGRPKSWWTEVDDDELDTELDYLRTEIYHWRDADPLIQKLTAVDRYKERAPMRAKK
ncbi:DNA polymerase-3 subunit epsilon [Ochrobactrum daejeonense]|uniref:DNA polymerase-3 subunit epsilon n=1 Tax=Brucella daejeonensis TaxID=659015 RepID=A0A7W9ENF0_9HYPH|nr:3'-5' exonuclease [Brucella daejeonensis]MBB5703080.1 DNA polymerase-3 subunit epsilon [Brucella daejeonensis]